MKKIITIIFAFALVFALAGCGGGSSDMSGAVENKGPTDEAIASSGNATDDSGEQSTGGSTVEETGQFGAPAKGDTVAIINVKDYGTIKVRFFADKAPKAVENFLTHAKNGYYNGLGFHRIIKDFMIQGGDPLGSGMGGESIWNKGFKVEIDNDLRHYAGALSMARSNAIDSQGSQFFIVQNEKFSPMTEAAWKQAESQAKSTASKNKTPLVTFPKEVRDNYAKHGGSPHLDGSYTVFGQVYGGLDIVNKIASVKVGSDGQTPTKKPVIEKITVEEIK